jgi:hypothetical protein
MEAFDGDSGATGFVCEEEYAKQTRAWNHDHTVYLITVPSPQFFSRPTFTHSCHLNVQKVSLDVGCPALPAQHCYCSSLDTEWFAECGDFSIPLNCIECLCSQ